MTATDWDSYSRVNVHVVTWPPTEPTEDGRVRTRWDLTTLVDLGVSQGSTIRIPETSEIMSCSATAVGPRGIRMTCDCADGLPDPYKMGAASVVWRFLDESCARLWTIGGVPRAHYPEFMLQRRKMVGDLASADRRTWLWLAVIRNEPLFAYVFAKSSQRERLFDVLWRGGHAHASSEFLALYGDAAPLEAGKGVGPAALEGVSSLLASSIDSAVAAMRNGSVNLMCQATEMVFDALRAHESPGAEPSGDGLAAAEDIAWFQDCIDLGGATGRGVLVAIARGQVGAARLESALETGR